MKKIINKSQWDTTCKGFIFTGCAIRSNNVACIIARKDLTEEEVNKVDEFDIPTRILTIFEKEGSDSLSVAGSQLAGYSLPKVGVSQIPMNLGFVLSSDKNSAVLPVGGGRADWPLEYIDKGNLRGINSVRCIDGYTYVASPRRAIYKRENAQEWVKLTEELDSEGKLFDIGFKDVDGFSADDIYAVGGKGDIWHYDGNLWNQCGFPTNQQLNAVCCAGDGMVYVVGRNNIWRGRHHTWEMVCEIDGYSKVNCARWFADRLWITTDYKMWVLNNGSLEQQVIYNDEVLPLHGYIDACEHFLLVTTHYSVWTFDGKDWCNIIANFNAGEL